MRRFYKKGTFVISAFLVGSMMMSGCSASGNQEEEQTIQEESSVVIIESTHEETQPETETEAASTEETQTITETETQPETETEAASMEETETESTPEAQPETQSVPQEDEQESNAAAEGSVSSGDFCMTVKGVTIPLGDDMRNYTALLGDPDAYGSAKSCVEEGDDKVYTYGGVVIYTYITNGMDIISIIEIEGNESLPSGIHIGSTKADVIAAYGSNYTEEGTELLYEMGGKTIGIQMNGDTVSFIELFGR